METKKLLDGKKQSTRFIVDEITKICTTMSKRDPGSEGETKACEYMAEKMRSYGADAVVEPFEIHPGSFFGWIYITMTCFILAAVAVFFSSLIALVLVVIGYLPMILQFVLYTKTLDPLYPKKTSHNVTAIKKCTGDVKCRVFFNGHPDATWEWSTNYHFGGKVFIGQFVVDVIGSLYLVGTAIVKWVLVGGVGGAMPEGITLILPCVGLLFVPLWFITYFISDTKTVVDGANDNLTGCYMGIALLKALKENNIELEHTEVGVIISGSEECGLRGGKAWADMHKGEYQDVPTIIVSYDTIHDPKCLQVNMKDLNALVPADKEGSELFLQACEDVGVYCGKGTVPFGATDCAAFTQGGFRSVGVTGLAHTLEKYYHTRLDSYDNLDEQGLENCYAATVAFLNAWDHKYSEE